MQLPAIIMSALFAGIGAIGVFWPDTFIEVGRSLSTPTGLLVAAALRIVFGAALLMAAPELARAEPAALVRRADPDRGSRHAACSASTLSRSLLAIAVRGWRRVAAHLRHGRDRARMCRSSGRCRRAEHAAAAMIDARELWPLVEARARATPDALCAVDERGARLSFARAARARGARRGRRSRSAASGPTCASRGSCRPGSSRSCWWLRSRGSARCRTRCCRSTASARSASSRARCGRAGSSCRACFAAPTTPRSRARVLAATARDGGPPCSLLVCDRALPEADPAALPPFAPAPRRARALDLLHLGHHGRSEGRAAQRRDDRRRARAASSSVSSSAPTIATRSCSRSRTSAGSGCCSCS